MIHPDDLHGNKAYIHNAMVFKCMNHLAYSSSTQSSRAQSGKLVEYSKSGPL